MLKKLFFILFLIPFTATPFKDKTFQKDIEHHEAIFISAIKEGIKDMPEVLLKDVNFSLKLFKKVLQIIKKQFILVHNKATELEILANKEKLEDWFEILRQHRGFLNLKRSFSPSLEKYDFLNNLSNHQLFQLIVNKYSTHLALIEEKKIRPEELLEYFEYDEVMELIEYIGSLLDKVIKELTTIIRNVQTTNT